jgi:hypothetical protein
VLHDDVVCVHHAIGCVHDEVVGLHGVFGCYTFVSSKAKSGVFSGMTDY